MRIQTTMLLIIAIMVFSIAAANRAQADVDVRVTFNELNEYGEWVIIPGYGTVWRPDADPDWRPFIYGRWVSTSDGWMWDSDEPFGWIVCHYGNWFFDDVQGWVWLPGYTWSSARVSWHVTDNEIGWAPLFLEPRRGYHQNTIRMQWTFAPLQFFTSVEVRNHVVVRTDPAPKGVRGYVYTGPPRRELIHRNTLVPVVDVALNKFSVPTRKVPLVRVQVRNREPPGIEVPVGPKYRRVPGQNQPQPQKSITVTHTPAVRFSDRQEQFDNPRPRAELPPAAPAAKVTVKSRDGRSTDDGADDEEMKKVEIKVRTR